MGRHRALRSARQLQAGAKITLTTPAKDGSKGNVITVGGVLQAPTIEIDGGPAASIIQVTTGILDAVFPWTSSSWPFASPPAGLPALAFPTNPSTTSQIAIYGDGGSEQILLWGSLTAGQTNIYTGTGVDTGGGNALIALNPLNDDGYVLNTLGHRRADQSLGQCGRRHIRGQRPRQCRSGAQVS